MEKGFSNTGIPLYVWVSSPDSVFSLFSFLGGRSTCSYSLDRSIMGSLGCHFGPVSYFKIGQVIEFSVQFHYIDVAIMCSTISVCQSE